MSQCNDKPIKSINQPVASWTLQSHIPLVLSTVKLIYWVQKVLNWECLWFGTCIPWQDWYRVLAIQWSSKTVSVMGLWLGASFWNRMKHKTELTIFKQHSFIDPCVFEWIFNCDHVPAEWNRVCGNWSFNQPEFPSTHSILSQAVPSWLVPQFPLLPTLKVCAGVPF